MIFTVCPDRQEPPEPRCDKCGGTGRVACEVKNKGRKTCSECVDNMKNLCDNDERIPCPSCS
jgi:hypothetical protein